MVADQPGSGDSYWYEWYVGLEYVIELLVPGTNVESVTFQEARLTAIDDVVVRFRDGTPTCCFQVKHARETSQSGCNVTSNTLVTKEKNKDGSPKRSLLGSLAYGWREFKCKNGREPHVLLYTNRSYGSKSSNRTYDEKVYRALPVGEFFGTLKSKVAEVTSVQEIQFGDDDLDAQFKEFVESIDCLDESQLLRFLRSLEIETSQLGLDDEKNRLIELLSTKVCAGKMDLASDVFDKLCASLRDWTTSERRSKVTLKEVQRCVESVNRLPVAQPIKVAVPNPIFPSREQLARGLSKEILADYCPVTFIAGDAGAGKTRLVSSMCEMMTPSPVRFHAFKPLDVDDYSFAPDKGVTDSRSMWSTLLNDIRSSLIDWSADPSPIPVINILCTEEELRGETMRLAEKLSDERNAPTFIIIDGIDHAARCGDAVTFLCDIPSPENWPAGVKLVLVGQPREMYPAYPEWLRTQNDLVRTIEIPPLCVDDIVCLVEAETKLEVNAARIVAEEIHRRTGGNTLGAVYAVRSIAWDNTREVGDAIFIVRESRIGGNIQEYYAELWKGAERAFAIDAALDEEAHHLVLCTMYLLDGIVSPGILSSAFPNVFKESYKAEMGLEALSPVVRKSKDGRYRPIHNDFRIFVSKRALAEMNSPRLKYVARQLADYALDSADSFIRGFYGVRLLKNAGMRDKCAELFNTGFVMDAMRIGVSWPLLCEQAFEAYQSACDRRDFRAVYRVILAMFTMSQIAEHTDYYGEDQYMSRVVGVLPSDLYLPPLSEEHLGAYLVSLLRIRWLLENDSNNDNATELYDMWFGGHTPASFVLTVVGDEYVPQHIGCEEKLGNLMERWGGVAAFLGYESEDACRDMDESQGLLRELVQKYCDGYAFEKLSTMADASCVEQFLNHGGFTRDGVLRILREGLSGSAGRFDGNLKVFCKEMVRAGRKADSSRGDMILPLCAAVAISSGNASGRITGCIDLRSAITDIRYSGDRASALVAWCFMESYTSNETSLGPAVTSALSSMEELKGDGDFSFDFPYAARAAACLGFAAGHGIRINPDSEGARALNAYLLSDFDNRRCLYYADLLLQYILFGPCASSLWIEALEQRALRRYALSSRQYKRKLRLLDYLADRGDHDVIGAFVKKQFNEDGSLAEHDVYDSETIAVLMRYVDLTDCDLGEEAKRKKEACRVSFTEHKDDALRHLVGLFGIAAKNGDIEESDAWRLISIDRRACEDSNADESREIGAAVLDWAIEVGISQVSRISAWDLAYAHDDWFLWRQFEGLLRVSATSEDIFACLALACIICCLDDELDDGRVTVAARMCINRASEICCSDLVASTVSEIIDVTNVTRTVEQSVGPYSHAKGERRKDLVRELKEMQIADVEAIAYEGPFDSGSVMEQAELACEELVARGESFGKVYNRLAKKRRSDLANGGWEWYSNSVSSMIRAIAWHANDDCFFELLLERGRRGITYGLSTPASDVAFAMRHRLEKRSPGEAVMLFRDECASKEAWLSANGALPTNGLGVPDCLGPIADSIGSYVVDICTKLIVCSDENATLCKYIEWGCAHSPNMSARMRARAECYLPSNM